MCFVVLSIASTVRYRALWSLPKHLKRLPGSNEMFRNGQVHKTYWAITRNRPENPEGELLHYITTTDKKQTKSYASITPKPRAKEAKLRYRHIASSDRYNLIEVELLTGRKHQIRVQLSAIGCPIKGDLKYGDKRSNPDGSISLMARHIEFIHPVSKEPISLDAPMPEDNLWQAFVGRLHDENNQPQ